MNPESRELHARFREGVRKAISAQAAFEGPPRKPIGWKEIRATWMAAPRRVGARGLNNSSGGDPRSGALRARIPRGSGPVGSGQRPVFGRPMTTWLTSGDREPGSGWRDDAEAAAANDAIRDGRWADVALIRAMFEEPTPGPRFKPPPKSEWFDDCEYARGGGETVCAPAPQVNLAHDTQVDEAITRNTYGEEVNIADDCPESFKELFRVAWTFLVDNEDIVRWATCLVHGVSFRDRIVEKLTQGWFLDFKADIGCDDGGEFGGPCLAHATASSGPVIGIEVCVESGGDASKWLDLFENGTSVEKLCGVVEAATLLFHELNHVAATWDSMDYFESKNHKLHEKCTGSHVSESIWRWAIYQRFPQALEAACCSDLFELNDDGSWDFDEQYMNGNPPSLDHECEVAGVD